MNHLLAFLTVAFTLALLTSAEVTCPPSPGDEPVYLPHEAECGKFYECSGRKAILFECPPGTYFDSTLNICNWVVDCGNLATSTAPPETTTAQTTTAPTTTPED